MIREMQIRTHALTGKLKVIIYTGAGGPKPRRYNELSKSSCKRLQKIIRNRDYDSRVHIWNSGISVWIVR